jgi:hypothetical protein
MTKPKSNGLGYKGKKRPESVDARSVRISQLLPLVSGLRHAKDPDAKACAVVLQEAICDLERLNDIEMRCSQYNEDPLRPVGGPSEELFEKLNEILSRS